MPTWHTRHDSATRDELQQSLHRGEIRSSVSRRSFVTCSRHLVLGVLVHIVATMPVQAAGSLTIRVQDEASRKPVATRFELFRGTATGKPMPLRRTVPAGVGVVLDRSVEVSLAEGDFAFRMIRGPEYRVLSGTFSLERTSLDERSFALPRMVDMLKLGWTSGDCLVPATNADLDLRMASEDLHVAAVMGEVETLPVPANKTDEPLEFEPVWNRTRADVSGGLAFYDDHAITENATTETGEATSQLSSVNIASTLPVERLARVDDRTSVAIENPFAWPVPVWLASQKIDGVFVLGDWLRLDRPVLKVTDGREPPGLATGQGRSLGRSAERIYWNMLDAGFKIPPLAGTGDDASGTPVGYNRLYVAQPLSSYEPYTADDANEFPQEARPVDSEAQWWAAAWAGQSVATNGPLLRPKLAGELPGHTFTANRGEVLELALELTLSVRDPVDYLEVVHNGEVHYSARLDEFALAGGNIPILTIDESGWVLVRVVTLFDDHFRAATSAPWYIEFDGRRRVARAAVEYFQTWQADYEQRLRQLSPAEIQRHAPFVQAARQFWALRMQEAI